MVTSSGGGVVSLERAPPGLLPKQAKRLSRGRSIPLGKCLPTTHGNHASSRTYSGECTCRGWVTYILWTIQRDDTAAGGGEGEGG